MNFEDRVRYVERTGANLGSILVCKDPWKMECGRSNCRICPHQPGKCDQKNTFYRWTCLLCQEKGQKSQYFGETSRSSFERIAEHLKMIEKEDENSPMVEHIMEFH